MSAVTVPEPSSTEGVQALRQMDGTLRCTAHSSRTGKPCRQRPITGGTVCLTHGGRAPQVKAAAARRLAVQAAEADAAAMLGQLGLEPVADPVAEIGRLAASFLATAEAAAARVNALTSIRYRGGEAGTEQLRAEVAVMERAGDRALRALDIQAKHQAGHDGDPDGEAARVVADILAIVDKATGGGR